MAVEIRMVTCQSECRVDVGNKWLQRQGRGWGIRWEEEIPYFYCQLLLQPKSLIADCAW